MNIEKSKQINSHLYEFCEDFVTHEADKVSIDYDGENLHEWTPAEFLLYLINEKGAVIPGFIEEEE